MSFWNSTTEAFTTIMVAIVGVAFIAVLVSKKSNTAAVVQSVMSGFANNLDVAVSPVTGDTSPPNLSYPSAASLYGGTSLN